MKQFSLIIRSLSFLNTGSLVTQANLQLYVIEDGFELIVLPPSPTIGITHTCYHTHFHVLLLDL